MHLLEIKNLKKDFKKETKAVKEITFNLDEGESIVLLGTNGSGKTTTIKSLLKQIKFSGDVLYNSSPLTEDHIINDFSYVPQEKNIFDYYKTGSLVTYIEEMNPRFQKNLFVKFMNDFEIPLNKRIRSLSGGMKSIILLSMALSFDSRVYIFDEPLTGIDPLSTNKFLQIIRELTFKGKSVIYSTNIISEAEKLGDKVAIMKKGKILELDTIDNLKSKFCGIVLNKEPRNYFYKKELNNSHALYIFKDTSCENIIMEYPECQFENMIFDDIFESIIRGVENV